MSRWSSLIKASFKALWSHRGRSALTILGVVLGITCIILMQAMTNASFRHTQEDLKESVNDKIVIRQAKKYEYLPFGETEYEQLKKIASDSDAGYSQRIVLFDIMSAQKKLDEPLALEAVSLSMLDIQSVKLMQGRKFKEADYLSGAKICLLSHNVIRQLGLGASPIDQDLFLDGKPFKIVGIYEDSFSSYFEAILVPYPLISEFSKSDSFTKIFRQMESSQEGDNIVYQSQRYFEHANKVSREVGKELYQFAFSIDEVRERARDADMFRYVLLGIASVCLLVGGVGVMNMMLVSVTERRWEIGLRMSLGARGIDIIVQFVLESVVLCSIGSLLGVLLGVFACWCWFYFMESPMLVLERDIFWAIVVGSGTGLVAGLYPAIKASRMTPVEALRTR